MSTKSRFCPLCDVLVDVWLTPDDNLANPDYRLNWLQEVRALRTTEELEGSFITGTGWLDIEGNVIAPVEYDSHYRNYEPLQDLHQDFATHEIGYPQCEPAEYWCYVLHDACWKLLRERVDPNHEVPVNSLAHHLFAILFNTPVSAESEALVPGHNYGHASQLHPREGEVHGRYFTRVNLTSYSFITGDITEEFVPEEESLENEAKYFYAYLANSYTKHRNYSKPDPFLLLPSELIVLILAQLPSRDVCNLRLASRYTADRSSPEFLDQKFWSSRFGPDFEMGFVFAGLSNSRPAEPADWRALYLKAVCVEYFYKNHYIFS
ncbi:putative f-box domain containing protein [Daldinia childiae]|uniref:putative f-box domain containing protein n=1 Tax=Daldinia childiae TaxID=326645 RepID=UPI0014458D7E|nr:putative f-box domain containing protein [Daldinia childiae]KAF3065009.1 putative f-box domain containing protein [Daldinia childiae]